MPQPGFGVRRQLLFTGHTLSLTPVLQGLPRAPATALQSGGSWGGCRWHIGKARAGMETSGALSGDEIPRNVMGFPGSKSPLAGQWGNGEGHRKTGGRGRACCGAVLVAKHIGNPLAGCQEVTPGWASAQDHQGGRLGQGCWTRAWVMYSSMNSRAATASGAPSLLPWAAGHHKGSSRHCTVVGAQGAAMCEEAQAPVGYSMPCSHPGPESQARAPECVRVWVP